MNRQIPREIAQIGKPVWTSYFSALDIVWEVSNLAGMRFLVAQCGLQTLAQQISELAYPGLFFADAAYIEMRADSSETFYINCADKYNDLEKPSFAPLDLLATGGQLFDPNSNKNGLRASIIAPRTVTEERTLFEAAILVSRYPYTIDPKADIPVPKKMSPETQRVLLSLMLTGDYPHKGLQLLLDTGFAKAYWPEIAALHGTLHSKEYHPEGDAWVHTLSTFANRKTCDLTLSLALLFHDVGKPRSTSTSSHRFSGHAEIGAHLAARFLAKLGFAASLIDNVTFLVQRHMMPAAVTTLPASRLELIVDDPRFPLLLELFRCDEFSSWRGPDAYYQACAWYKAWQKNRSNPYRTADGRKSPGKSGSKSFTGGSYPMSQRTRKH